MDGWISNKRVAYLREESDSLSRLSSTSRTTDPVGVCFDAFGHVVIDDEGDVLDVDTTAGHVGGHQDVLGAGLQTRKGELTLFLTLATVQRGRIVTEKGKTLH